jgi:hypothetical protein
MLRIVGRRDDGALLVDVLGLKYGVQLRTKQYWPEPAEIAAEWREIDRAAASPLRTRVRRILDHGSRRYQMADDPRFAVWARRAAETWREQGNETLAAVLEEAARLVEAGDVDGALAALHAAADGADPETADTIARTITRVEKIEPAPVSLAGNPYKDACGRFTSADNEGGACKTAGGTKSAGPTSESDDSSKAQGFKAFKSKPVAEVDADVSKDTLAQWINEKDGDPEDEEEWSQNLPDAERRADAILKVAAQAGPVKVKTGPTSLEVTVKSAANAKAAADIMSELDPDDVYTRGTRVTVSWD